MSLNVITDQKIFMDACGQSTVGFNKNQYDLYVDLIREEFTELEDAVMYDNKVEVIDAVLDIITVCVGLLHSSGCDAQGAWDEVVRSNMSKVDPSTGKVIRRDDGKILKPSSYSPPDLLPFMIS